MKAVVVLICIVIFEAFIGTFVLGLISCSGDRDEESRKLEDEEQAEYIERWFKMREERRRKKEMTDQKARYNRLRIGQNVESSAIRIINAYRRGLFRRKE